MICAARWLAPRVEVPDSVTVNHVCGEPMDHPGPHRCGCGAQNETGTALTPEQDIARRWDQLRAERDEARQLATALFQALRTELVSHRCSDETGACDAYLAQAQGWTS